MTHERRTHNDPLYSGPFRRFSDALDAHNADAEAFNVTFADFAKQVPGLLLMIVALAAALVIAGAIDTHAPHQRTPTIFDNERRTQ